MVTVAFAGGGTGGHIYPGLAVAGAILKKGGVRLIWIGSDKGMDKSVVESSGLDIQFFGVPAGKLRRYFSLRNFSDLFKIAGGFFAARKILKREKPSLLFSKGGFASVPPAAAAASLHIPVFTHESDFSPGLATHINSRFSQKIFTAYPDTAECFSVAYRERVVVTGNPVREAFRNADPARGLAFLGISVDSSRDADDSRRTDTSRILLALGGSQGAREVNDMVRGSLADLCRYYTVVHQTGQADWDIPASERYKPFRYIGSEMPDLLQVAELVVGRSGAGTVWECAAAGKPMVLVPLRGSGTRGDQVENARFFEKAGAAVVIAEDKTNAAGLYEAVAALAEDNDKRAAMSQASLSVGRMDATQIIASLIFDFLKKQE